MTRAERIAEARSQIIRVRYYGGTYIATGGGKRTSCTQGAEEEVVSLAFKLFNGPRFRLVRLAEPNTWRAIFPEAT